MKRSVICAALAALCLLFTCGCGHAEPQQPAQSEQPAPVQSQPAEPTPELPEPAQEVQPEPEPPAEPEVPAEPVYPIRSGIWLAKNDLGYSNYYHFDSDAQSGRYLSLDYGLGTEFSYEGSGTDLTFRMADGREDCTAVIEPTDEDHFTIIWENTLAETLSFVQEGSLDGFHFYSNDDLCRMAADHYALNNEDTPGLQAAMTNEDNTVTVQLYDNLGDHNSTSAWYIVDRFTAVATNLLTGEEFELEEAEAEFPEFPEDAIFLEQTDPLPEPGEEPVEVPVEEPAEDQTA